MFGKKAFTTSNISSAWEKSGIFPLKVERVLENKYVRQALVGKAMQPGNQRHQININGIEITTFKTSLQLFSNCEPNAYSKHKSN